VVVAQEVEQTQICTINFGERLYPRLRTKDRVYRESRGEFGRLYRSMFFLLSLARTAMDGAFYLNERWKQKFLIRR
jgi:hypothetical protein